MPGPAPKIDPVRRNARPGGGIVRLPAEGRKGPAPRWPLGDKPSEAERKAWRQLWATPQAVAWERLGWTRTVARYCRTMIAAERTTYTGAAALVMAEARQLEDRLGLTPKAMRLLLWEIVVDEMAEQRAAPASVRGRIKAV